MLIHDTKFTHNTSAKPPPGRAFDLMRICLPQTEWEAKKLQEHAVALLNLAAAEGRMERVHELLDAGAPLLVEHEDNSEEGWTILHHVIAGEVLYPDGRNGQILDDLLARPEVREIIDHRTDHGHTALHAAITGKMDGAAACLIEHGAKLDHSGEPKPGVDPLSPVKKEWDILRHPDFLTRMPKALAAYAKARTTDINSGIDTLASLGGSMAQSFPGPETLNAALGASLGAIEKMDGVQDRTSEQEEALFKATILLLGWIVRVPTVAFPAHAWQNEGALRLLGNLRNAGFDLLAPLQDTPEHAKRRARIASVSSGNAAIAAAIQERDLQDLTPPVGPARASVRL